MATSSSTGTSSNPQQQQQSGSDDYILPYLVVGTEVSAKFKGAFCEAKIKKCDLALKCKLTLKTASSGSPSITVSYDQLRTATGGPITYNDLRPGSTVYVTKETAAAESSDKSISKAAAGELQQATLNKVIDQSEYSVVFNDGDEMTLKRSRIRYKGEKHFLDSETLNHAPLNNPEHFLFPIKNKSEAAAASESESESVATTSSNKANSRSLPRSGKQQQQPTTTRMKREKEAPAEEAAGDDAESSGSSDVDSDSSDDYPPEEKDRFVAQLYKFMDDRGTPMNKVPAVNKVDLDLHKFFIVVKKNGGFNKVCKQRKWSEVYKKLNLPDINSANVSNLKSAYERYLHPYEDFYRKLGSTMCDLGSHRPSTSASASKRSLASELHQRAPASTSHLFKPRYLSQTQSSAQKIKQTTSTPTAASKSADRLTSTSSTTSTPPGAGGVGSASTTTPETQPAPTNKPATASSCDVSSMEDQLTIESLAKSLTTDIQTPGASAPTTAPAAANSMLLSTSIASSDDADKTMSLAGGLPEDTLTLSGIARNISEDFKKSKKEAAAATTSSSFSSAATTGSTTTTPALTPSGATAKRGRRGRRTSSESGLKTLGSRPKSVKNEPRDDDADNDLDADNDDDDDEEASKINDDTTDDEPKPKKKYARASSDLDTSSSTSKSTSNSSAFKRKNTIKSEQQTESDSQESMSHSFKLNQFTADDLEVNQLIEVKYGHGKTTYQAKIVKIEREDNTVWVHYLGWNNRYDEWIEISKIIRIFNENCSNKRRKPSKVGSAPVIATTVRRGASANDADSNGKSSNKKKTPSTSSASSSSSGDNKIDKPPPGSKRVSSQSSLDRQTSNEDATVATAASHPDNLLSIKEEIMDYQSASGADNANDSEAHENVFEEPVVAKSSTASATASAAANKEESEPEEIAAPVSSAISSSSSSPPDSNRVSSIQPPDFSLEEFSTKPAAIISSTSGSMLPPATVVTQEPTTTLNNSSSSQIEIDVKKELVTPPTVSISPLPPPPPPPAPSPAATPAPSTPPGPSRRRTSTRVSSTNTVSSNNNTPIAVVESISDDNVSDANKANVKSESELITPIPPPPPVVVPSTASLVPPPTTGFSDEDFKENKKEKQNKSNTTETTLNNSNNNSTQSNNQETNSQSNGVLKTHHGSATFNTVQNEPFVFSKYPFHLNGCTFTGKARIRFIEEQMRLCREEYMKRKNEIAAIDRKRKLKRSQHDKTNNDGESNSAANSSILNASTSQKK